MTTTTRIQIRREFDIRKADWFTGQKVAAEKGEMFQCECCGRLIVKVCEMMNGLFVGSECAYYMALPVYRLGRTNKKANAILEAAA
jgi:hypothetical protein